MKYCIFDQGDIIGPLSVEELFQQKGFGPHSLICPEKNSEDGSYWKEAQLYVNFAAKSDGVSEKATKLKKNVRPPAPPKEKTKISAQADQKAKRFVAEVSQVSRELESLDALDKDVLVAKNIYQPQEVAPVPQQPGVTATAVASVAAKKTANTAADSKTTPPNPIEEYFKTMQGGDLGNILGMPDPKANSDMNLSKVFDKTDPSFNQPLPEAQNTATSLASAAKFGATTTDNSPASAQSNAQPTDVPQPAETKAPEGTEPAASPAVEQAIPVLQDVHDKSETPVAEPEPQKPVIVEETQEQAELSQEEPELELDFEDKEEIPVWMNKRALAGGWFWIFLIGLLCVVLAGGYAAYRYRNQIIQWTSRYIPILAVPSSAAPVQEPVKIENTVPKEVVAQPVIAVVEPSKTQEEIATEKIEQAKEFVQKYQLDNGRGTVQEYLNRTYADELAKGATAAWSAEPLHKDIYMITYRITRTRKEPIVYIFQADIAKKKLTGALNNITLDLVGKIK